MCAHDPSSILGPRVYKGQFKTKLNNQMIQDILNKNRNLLMDYSEEFRATFKVPLHHFFNMLFGFDVVKFDKWLNVPYGMSTKDFLLEHYNQKAVELIEKLL